MADSAVVMMLGLRDGLGFYLPYRLTSLNRWLDRLTRSGFGVK